MHIPQFIKQSSTSDIWVVSNILDYRKCQKTLVSMSLYVCGSIWLGLFCGTRIFSLVVYPCKMFVLPNWPPKDPTKHSTTLVVYKVLEFLPSCRVNYRLLAAFNLTFLTAGEVWKFLFHRLCFAMEKAFRRFCFPSLILG